MAINWKCSITLAILTVLVYLLLVNLMTSMMGPGVGTENVEWYKSMEAVLFYSVLISYNLNQSLFVSCRM
jgi:hypothetical protein